MRMGSSFPVVWPRVEKDRTGWQLSAFDSFFPPSMDSVRSLLGNDEESGRSSSREESGFEIDGICPSMSFKQVCSIATIGYYLHCHRELLASLYALLEASFVASLWVSVSVPLLTLSPSLCYSMLILLDSLSYIRLLTFYRSEGELWVRLTLLTSQHLLPCWPPPPIEEYVLAYSIDCNFSVLSSHGHDTFLCTLCT